MAHRIFIALDGPLLGFLRTETQAAKNAPDVRLAKAYAMHSLDNGTHASAFVPLRSIAFAP